MDALTTFMNEVEQQIGREMTASERKTVAWLFGWEKEVRDNVISLLRAAVQHGSTNSNK